jgi:PhnB protein
MPKPAKPIPEGYTAMTPALVVSDAKRALEVYKQAFDAKVKSIAPAPDGKRLMHAEVEIFGAMLMFSDSFPEMGGPPAPAPGARHPFSIHMYVDNADAVVDRAVKAGFQVTMPLMDMFWGDRYARLRDPFGHDWAIATHKEDLTPEELNARQKAWEAEMAKGH